MHLGLAAPTCIHFHHFAPAKLTSAGMGTAQVFLFFAARKLRGL